MQLIKNILDLIPQRPPMVMIDELLACDEEVARTSFSIKADDIFVENGQLSEAGLLENIAQTAASRAGYMAKNNNEPVKIGYIGAVKDYEVFELPKVGDTLETEIKITNQVFDVTVVNGSVYCNSK